jgi:uncharacterized protein (TIGR01777 family)
MRVLVVGGSGFIGTRLVEALRGRGDEVSVTGRRAEVLQKRLGAGVRCIAWDPGAGVPPAEALAGVDGVINLAGEPVEQRWNQARKARIRESRVTGTRNLVAGIAAADPRPRVLVNASAIGYYGDRKHQWVDEGAPPADDFLAEVCVAWEAEAQKARAAGVRVAIVRIGIVLGRGGGAYPPLAKLFRRFLGGTIGQGYEWMSWVHLDDVVGVFLHCLDRDVSGVFNATAPNPASNGEFTRTLGSVLHRPAFAMIPKLAVRLLKGEFAKIITSSTRARPLRTAASGYEFKFPRLREALLDLERKR